MALKGAGDVIANLKRVQSEFAKKRRQALTRIGVIVKGDAVKMTPVDSGNLRSSAFYEVTGDDLTIGYTAHYAAAVHEMVEQKLKGEERADFGETRSGVSFGGGTGKGKYWDSGEPKFLEKAVKNNRKRILEELAKGGIT